MTGFRSLLLLAALGTASPAAAQPLTTARLEGAIKKGVGFLRKQVRSPRGPFCDARGLEANFLLGRCGLGTFTLLKCGVPGDDPGIARCFTFMYKRPLEKTYSAAMLALAIEARYAPTAAELAKDEQRLGYAGVARAAFEHRAKPLDKTMLERCVTFLVKKRQKGGWRYPEPGDDGARFDNSNTQYAMLALKSARRLGLKVPAKVFEQVADHFVRQQDTDGPEVPWFSVPAADRPILDLLPLAKRERAVGRLRRRREKAARKRKGTHARDGAEHATLRARGWSYLPRTRSHPAGSTDELLSSGSMTASGIAALCIAKSELEQTRGWKKRREKVERAIRDGCAWMARFYAPEHHPTGRPKYYFRPWHYYYLYGVERAGVLAGTYTFGPKDWWESGAAWLLREQEDWGAWPKGPTLSDTVNTCFALLFLRRATIPLAPLPRKRVMTGPR